MVCFVLFIININHTYETLGFYCFLIRSNIAALKCLSRVFLEIANEIVTQTVPNLDSKKHFDIVRTITFLVSYMPLQVKIRFRDSMQLVAKKIYSFLARFRMGNFSIVIYLQATLANLEGSLRINLFVLLNTSKNEFYRNYKQLHMHFTI